VKVAIYARVSTTDQNAEMQIRELNDYAGKQRWLWSRPTTMLNSVAPNPAGRVEFA